MNDRQIELLNEILDIYEFILKKRNVSDQTAEFYDLKEKLQELLQV